MKSSYNLNHEIISVNDFPYGKTQAVIVKVGKRQYYIDVDKCSQSITLSVYDVVSKARKTFSKYDANLRFITLSTKNLHYIDRQFMSDLDEIILADKLVKKYNMFFSRCDYLCDTDSTLIMSEQGK